MENYRTGPHSRFDLKYHFVWITKYRKGVLVGEVGIRLRELVREVCQWTRIVTRLVNPNCYEARVSSEVALLAWPPPYSRSFSDF